MSESQILQLRDPLTRRRLRDLVVRLGLRDEEDAIQMLLNWYEENNGKIRYARLIREYSDTMASFIRNLDNVNDKLVKAAAAADGLAGALDNFARLIDYLKGLIRDLEECRRLDQLKQELDNCRQRLFEKEAALAEASTKLDEYAKRVEELNKQLEQASTNYNELSRQFVELKTTYEELKNKYEQVLKELSDLQSKYATASAQAGKLESICANKDTVAVLIKEFSEKYIPKAIGPRRHRLIIDVLNTILNACQ